MDTNNFVRAQPAAQFVIYVNVATQRFRWMCGNGLGERSSQKSSNEPLERWRLRSVWRGGDASRGAISLLAGVDACWRRGCFQVLGAFELA